MIATAVSFIFKLAISFLTSYLISRLAFSALSLVSDLVAGLISGWVFISLLPSTLATLYGRRRFSYKVFKDATLLYWLAVSAIFSLIHPEAIPFSGLASILIVLYWEGSLPSVLNAVRWRVGQIIHSLTSKLEK